jgi:hypothetical protein
LSNGIKDLKTVKSEEPKPNHCHRKTCRRRYCADSAEGEQLIASAFQELLRQEMLPWISATYLDKNRLSSRMVRSHTPPFP